jgi:hypothetical protein
MAGDTIVLIGKADVFLEAQNSTKIACHALDENDFHIFLSPKLVVEIKGDTE